MLASNKPLAKKILTYHRIPVPGFAVYKMRRTKKSKPGKLKFPLIVKSAVEHSSVGIAQASVVNDDASLWERVEFIHRNVGTDAIAEEFIPGREITIGILGNHRLETFPIWEMTFERPPDRSHFIATSRVKWDVDYQKKVGLTTAPAKGLDKAKSAEIVKLAKRIYRSLNMSGYARIDMRLAEDGTVWVIEANPNPDLCMVEDFAVSAAKGGLAYPELIQRIVGLGLAHRPAWKER
jgi:D-alanine-D-alanine ligase